MRFVKISQTEFSSILRLYESVMSYACHGLFYREGEALADNIAELSGNKENLLEYARKVLIARGWVEDIVFKLDEVRVRGSVEAVQGEESETCHRLRGIISRLYQLHHKKQLRFVEVECSSRGADECLFKPEVS